MFALLIVRSGRESYGDNAIGYVQVKRDFSTVKAKVTSEHSLRKKAYDVTLLCDEEILSVALHSCAASLAVGKTEKFINYLIENEAHPLPPSDGSFLNKVMDKSMSDKSYDSVLTKYFKEFSDTEALSIHHLLSKFLEVKKNSGTADEFINYCRNNMTETVCNTAAKETFGQSESALWLELQYAGITASKAYEAAYCQILEGCLFETILGTISLKDIAAMTRGKN
ncbi:unnamed protein product [Larinioides sclopetarius]|uniref:Uncharacterized protein n=1 Tax=Larinioides sclopetarius TaxID=280406 RepID=A0AAV2AMU8_9ARAC